MECNFKEENDACVENLNGILRHVLRNRDIAEFVQEDYFLNPKAWQCPDWKHMQPFSYPKPDFSQNYEYIRLSSSLVQTIWYYPYKKDNA